MMSLKYLKLREKKEIINEIVKYKKYSSLAYNSTEKYHIFNNILYVLDIKANSLKTYLKRP